MLLQRRNKKRKKKKTKSLVGSINFHHFIPIQQDAKKVFQGSTYPGFLTSTNPMHEEDSCL